MQCTPLAGREWRRVTAAPAAEPRQLQQDAAEASPAEAMDRRTPWPTHRIRWFLHTPVAAGRPASR